MNYNANKRLEKEDFTDYIWLWKITFAQERFYDLDKSYASPAI